MVQHMTHPGRDISLVKVVVYSPGPAEVAQARLAASPYMSLRTLTCDNHEGVLAIRGQVPTYYLKQMAQTIVRDVPGVEIVNNQVQVEKRFSSAIAAASNRG